jgi:hypothetical protein
MFINTLNIMQNNYARGKLAISGKAAAPSRPLPLLRHSATRSGGDDA